MAKLDPGDGGSGGGGSSTEEIEEEETVSEPSVQEPTIDQGGLTENTTTTEPSTTSGSTAGTGTSTQPDTEPTETTQEDTSTTTSADTTETTTQERKDSTPRANQSVSFGTKGLGTSGTRQSRARERTPRANESPSLSTTTLGTTGTAQSRKREQTSRASESQDFSTDTFGTTQGTSQTTTDSEGQAGEEQFGDIDFSLGFGDPDVDEVEQFVDEQIGERGSEFVSEKFSDPLRGSTNPNAPNRFALAAANLAEEAPRIPSVALEGVEGAKFLLEGTTVAGGSEEEFDKRSAKAVEFAAGVAQAEAERAQEKPGVVGAELLLGAGIGKVASSSRFVSSGSRALDTSAARRAGSRYTPSKGSLSKLNPDVDTRVSQLLKDERGQGSLSGLLRKESGSGDGSTTKITAEDLEADIDEIRNRPPDAEEQIQNVREIRQRKQELMQEQSRRQSQDIDTDYTAPERGGGTSVSSQEFQTVSGGPSTFRSGPTATQQQAFRSANIGGSTSATTRTPQLLQEVTPEQSLRVSKGIRASGQATQSGDSRVISAAGSAGAVGVGTGIESIDVGEGTTGLTQPATFSLDDKPTSQEDITGFEGIDSVAIGFSAGSSLFNVEDIQAAELTPDAQSKQEGSLPGIDQNTPTNVGTGSDTDIASDSDVDTGIGADTDVDVDVDTDVGTLPAQQSRTDSMADLDQGVATGPDGPRTIPNTPTNTATGQPPAKDRPPAKPTKPPGRTGSGRRRPLPSITLDSDSDKKRPRRSDPESFDKVFESDVASSEEVLGGDDDSSEDLFEGL